MDQSIFSKKGETPTEKDLRIALDKTFVLWQSICNLVYREFPAAISEWNYPGEKYGWSFRIKDKRRAILYFLPRAKFFKVAFVFGQKVFDKILTSSISEEVKNQLKEAKVYAEGRGIRIDVKNRKILADIAQLIEIKLSN